MTCGVELKANLLIGLDQYGGLNITPEDTSFGQLLFYYHLSMTGY